MKTNNIDKHDDAIRQVMQRMKDTREAPRLSADFEDRVMAQIEAIAPPRKAAKPSGKTHKMVRRWVLRAVSAAAVIAALIFTVEILMPNGKDEKRMMAKTQPQKPVKPIVAQEEPTLATTEEKSVSSPPLPIKHIMPKGTSAEREETPAEEMEATEQPFLPDTQEVLLALQDINKRMDDFKQQYENTAANTANILPEEEEMPDLQTDAYLAMQDISQRMNNFRKQHETNLNTGTPYEDLH